MKRVTSLLTLLLTWICVSMQAQVTPLTNVPDGDYYIVCPAKDNSYAYYDGTNAYLRIAASHGTDGTYVYTLTQGAADNAGKYTIQCAGKYVVAGTSLSHSGTPGNNVKLVDAAEATDANKWWVLAQDASNADLVDIFPNQNDITATTPAWNFAASHDGPNTAVGLWNASDNNSQWALVSATEDVEDALQIITLRAQLKATLDAISSKIGTELGQVVVNDYYTAARELLDNPNATLAELQAETANSASHYYTANLPEEGKYYYAENKNYPGKFLTTNSENQLTYSATPGRVLYERVPGTTDQVYIKVNGLYAGTCKQSTTVPAVSEQSAATPYGFEYYNGYIVMQDKVLGGWGNYLHCNGTVLGWEAAAGATQWTVKPADEMLIEKIQAKLDEVDAHTGTYAGQIQRNEAAYTAARALIAKADVTLDELEAEYAKDISAYYAGVNMPEKGVEYVLRDKLYPTYYLTSNGTNAVGQTTPGIVNFEPVEGTTDQFYIKVNGLYVGECFKSRQVKLSNNKADARRYSFGLSNNYVVMQDTEQTEETTHAYLHMDGSKNIVGWSNTADASMWIILSPEEALDVFKSSLQNVVTEVESNVGNNPGQYTLEDGGDMLNLAKDMLEMDDFSLSEFKWITDDVKAFYTINPFTPGYYRFRNAVKNGYMYSDGTNLKWKALNENDETMIWHVSAVNDSKLTLSNYGDKLIPQSSNFDTNVTMAEDANSSIDYLTMGSSQVKIRMNGLQGAYTNEDGTVKNYNTNANDKGTWYAERVDFLDAFEGLGFTAADKFDLPEDATVICSDEFEWSELTPAAINAAIDALEACATLSDKEAFMATENGQTLQRYRDMLTDYSGWATVATINLEMKAEYGTLILPFDAVRPDDLNVYTCNNVEGDGTTLKLRLSKYDLLRCTPYIVQGTEGAKYMFIGIMYDDERETYTEGLLTGVLTEGGVDVPGGSYVLSNYQNVLGFYMVENGVSKNCPQFKCYFTAPDGAANAKAFFFNPGDVTGIDAIVTDGGKADIYNVHGQRLNGLRKGLNIVNGRKVVVK